jgi:hypothetical protein
MLRAIMASEQLRLLGIWARIILALGGVSFLWFRLSARRYQRLAAWRELCLRLELVPEPGGGRVAAGQVQGSCFKLHDTGSGWLVEVPLSQPLLPPGVVLLSQKSSRLRPSFFWLHPLRLGSRLRALPVSSASSLPGTLDWYVEQRVPLSKAEASPVFLEEAERAAETHGPLRVEARRIVLLLHAGSLLSVNEIRSAVRGLEATARRWLGAVGVQGIPRMEALRLPSARALLRGVLAQHPPPCFQAIRIRRPLGDTLLGCIGWIILMTAWVFPFVDFSINGRSFGMEVVVGALVLVTSSFCFWIRGEGRPGKDTSRLDHQYLFIWVSPRELLRQLEWLGKVLFLWALEFRQSRRRVLAR